MGESGGIEVRKARDDDSGSMVALYHLGSGRSLSKARLAEYLASYPAAVAHEGSRLLGFAFCVPFAPDVVELGNLFVAAEARDRGIGSRLVRHVESQAAGRFHSMLLSNSMLHRGVPGKRSAAAFYERLGYQRIWFTGSTDIFARRLDDSADRRHVIDASGAFT